MLLRVFETMNKVSNKKVFGSENSKDILLSFLNSILDIEIVDLTIEDPYNVPKLQGMKDTAVDIKATLNDDTKVIIEMQILNHDGFESRILYNTAKNYANQLDSGDRYNLLKAFKIASTANMSKEEIELQEKREEFLFIQKNSIEKAKREARIEGLEEGREEGREEEKLKNALVMIKEFGLLPEDVAKKLDISLEILLKHI